MAESLLAGLLHTLDRSNISQIATSLGESEQCVSRGLESSLACILSSVAGRAEDPACLRRMLDLIPDDIGEVSWSKLSSGLSSSGWSWAIKAREVMSALFGTSESVVTNVVARDSGISSVTASCLLAMAAPMVMRFLTRRVHDEGWSMRSLGTQLQKEIPTLRSALPVGVSDLLLPPPLKTAATPVIAQFIQHDRRSAGWVGTLALTVLALGGFWLWNEARKPAAGLREAIGTANRMMDEAAGARSFVKRELPNSVELNLPANGMETRLLGIIRGSQTAGRAAWLEFDRLTFDSGSAALRPSSAEQLNNIAVILKSYPTVRLTIAGYTDGIGSAEQNLELSRERAESVKNELVARGIAPERIYTQGLGEQSAEADNSTAAGRARNRRVTLQVAER